MFQLDVQAIHTGASATDKQQAIYQVAAALAAAGNTGEAYVQGMLDREQQTTTYLGNGIAIPHGTTATRDLVLKTGVQVFQYPQGIDWGNGQTAWLVIGIAARSDEHLALLRQLTHVLSDESLEQTLKHASAEDIRAILMGEKLKGEFFFDNSMLSLDTPAEDCLTLQSANIARLRAKQAVDPQFIAHVLTKPALYLGDGIWLSDCNTGNLASAVAISRPSNKTLTEQGKPLSLLLTVAAVDEQPLAVMSYLHRLLITQRSDELFSADAAALVALLTSEVAAAEQSLSAEFVIRNEHGLHARPGTALVTVIKQFDCEVSITNLDGSGKPANGRSLMKVVALGVKKGHRLRFTISGPQANQALQAITEAIESGLGEGAA